MRGDGRVSICPAVARRTFPGVNTKVTVLVLLAVGAAAATQAAWWSVVILLACLCGIAAVLLHARRKARERR